MGVYSSPKFLGGSYSSLGLGLGVGDYTGHRRFCEPWALKRKISVYSLDVLHKLVSTRLEYTQGPVFIKSLRLKFKPKNWISPFMNSSPIVLTYSRRFQLFVKILRLSMLIFSLISNFCVITFAHWKYFHAFIFQYHLKSFFFVFIFVKNILQVNKDLLF